MNVKKLKSVKSVAKEKNAEIVHATQEIDHVKWLTVHGKSENGHANQSVVHVRQLVVHVMLDATDTGTIVMLENADATKRYANN